MAQPVEIEVDYHQFVLGQDSSDDEPVQVQERRVALVFEPRVTGAAIVTGCASGSVTVRVNPVVAAPPTVDDSWEDVAELSLTVTTGPLKVSGWGGTGPSSVRLDAAGPGTYRVRVHARGRDLLPDAVAFDPVEEFLLQAWPAPYGPPATLRATSKKARSEVGQ